MDDTCSNFPSFSCTLRRTLRLRFSHLDTLLYHFIGSLEGSLAINYCLPALQLPPLFRIIPCTTDPPGNHSCISFLRTCSIHSNPFKRLIQETSGRPPKVSTTLVYFYLRNLNPKDMLSRHPIYYAVLTKSRRETSQCEQGLFLFSLPLPSFGWRGLGLRIEWW